MNRIKEQLDLYNKGKEISGIAKKELEIRGLIQNCKTNQYFRKNIQPVIRRINYKLSITYLSKYK